MESPLDDMAGAPVDRSDDEARQACVEELRQAIARLRGRGMSTGSIIAALAITTMQVLDLRRQH